MNVKLLLRAIVSSTFLLLFSFQLSFSQDKTISGKVIDSKDNTPVVGASVTAKGTNVGTSTGADGAFTLSIPASANVLVISSVGFTTIEIPATENMEIKLTSGGTNLNEVVVTGYGTQRKREVTSAITKVSAESFNKGNISNVAQLLQGKVAGLSVARPGGDPNGGFTLRLRGLSTLGANTQPLVVVDGQIGADINTLDPNDIASIDVLKDGSAAAIYGTRGSAGVIIITSKTGRAGASQVNYNGAASLEVPFQFTPHMNAAEFKALNKGTDFGADTDWNKEITRTAFAHTHNISFSGGTQQTTYNASVNYRYAEGVAITTGFQQLNGRINLKHRALKNKLVFNLDINATKRNSSYGFTDAFKYATIFNPTAPIYVKDLDPSSFPDPTLYDLTGGGYFEQNFIDYSNPVAVLQQNTNKGENKRLNISGSADYEIIKGLKFGLRYGQQNNSFNGNQYSPRTAWISRGFIGGTGFARRGYLYKNNTEAFNQLFESTLSYQKRFDKLGVDAVAGYSYQDFLNEGMNAGGGDFITDASGQNFGAALDFANGQGAVGSYKNASRLVGFFGRVNLNWDDWLFASASLRREGSTMFGANNQWGMFPAVSAGIDLKKFVDASFINSLKFRASYGETGALPPQAYLSLDRLSTGGTNYYAGGGNYLQAYQGFVNANPDLGWEKKTEIDIGLDFALFNNRLTGTFDWYDRSTTDLIFNVTVPSPPNLFNNTWKNIGKLDNSGFELAINYDWFRNADFTWTTGLIYSDYNVILTELDESLKGSFVGATNLGTPGQEATQLTRAVEGEPIGILWGYKYMGLDANGKYLFADKDGKPVLQAANPERQIIGNGLPDFEFGVNNSFKYKNWDLAFFIRGSIGHQLINTFRAFYENPNVATSYNIINSKYFDPSVTDAQIYSSLHVEKASFAKLDNATLGYNFNIKQGASWSNVGVRNVRLYLTGQNLFTVTDYTGIDPEVRYQDGSNVLAPGIDRRETWVFTRTFTFGVNIGF